MPGLARRHPLAGVLILFTPLFLLTACMQQPEKLERLYSHDKEVEVYSTSAGVKNLLLKSPDGPVYCAEPPPDSTLDVSDSVGFSLSMFTSGSGGDEDSKATTEGGLGGRSVNVLISREIFYRLCEFYANTNLSTEQKIELFKSTLSAVVDLNQVDLGTGTAGETDVNVAVKNENDSGRSASETQDITENVAYPDADSNSNKESD